MTTSSTDQATGLTKKERYELRLKVWDLIIKSASIVGILFAVFKGVADLNARQTESLAQDQRHHEVLENQSLQQQAQHRYELALEQHRQRSKLYGEAVDSASQIASATDRESEDIKNATKRLRQLYWGELVMVENDGVARAMVNFKHKLDSLDGKNVVSEIKPGAESEAKSIGEAKLALDSTDAEDAGPQTAPRPTALRSLVIALAEQCKLDLKVRAEVRRVLAAVAGSESTGPISSLIRGRATALLQPALIESPQARIASRLQTHCGLAIRGSDIDAVREPGDPEQRRNGSQAT